MKTRIFTLMMTLLLGFGFYACSEEEIKPELPEMENIENSGGDNAMSEEDRPH